MIPDGLLRTLHHAGLTRIQRDVFSDFNPTGSDNTAVGMNTNIDARTGSKLGTNLTEIHYHRTVCNTRSTLLD